MAAGERPGARDRQRHAASMRVYFAERFPALEWQPSDVHPDALRSIAAWRAAAGLANVREPIAHRCGGARLADRPRRRRPQHQHGPHQPVGRGARADRRRGADARRRERR